MASTSGIVHGLGAALPPLNSPSISQLVAAAVGVGFATLFVWYALAWATSPLRKFPGPVLAGWTNFWRFAVTISDRYPLKMIELHKKYGPVVRIGPNTLVLNYPELINTMYGIDGKYVKTEMYHSSSSRVDGKIQYSLFATSDPQAATQIKRPIAKHYNWGAALALERNVDSALVEFCNQLEERFVRPQESFDIWEWCLYLTWDLSGTIIFSRDFGYLRRGCDFDGTIRLSEQVGSYFGMVSPLPWLDFWLDKNPVVKIGPTPFIDLATLAATSVAARVQGEDPNYDPAAPDYLQYFLDSKQQYPDIVDNGTIVGYVMAHIIAGSDSSAITMINVVDLILRHPGAYRKMVAEVRALDVPIDKPVPYSTAKALPYLDAVCRESMRVQPIVGSQMERYVPAEGLTLPDGRVVPTGTIVGVNPYVLGKNTAWFGEDACSFRPERWLKAEGESECVFSERRRRLVAADINFGAGSRTCLGKNLGLVEVYKTMATLANRYDMELEDPAGELEVSGAWVRRPKRLMVRFKPRA